VNEMKCKRLLLLGALMLMLALVPKAMQGQADLGTITGTISDSTGAVISSVNVTATQINTGIEFKTVSNNRGLYSLVELPPATYTVSFRRAGFRDLDHTGVVVEVQHVVGVNAVLQVGSVSTTVTVTGSPVLELQSEVGTNMNTEEMTVLPLSIVGNGRDITAFAFAVTPNVSGNGYAASIAGSQNFTTSVLLDGTSADSGQVGDVLGDEPSMDAIQESQVDTSGLSTVDGRTGGGVFLYELKSGTDRFHGAGFGFLDNEFLNANTWDNDWYLSQCAAGDTSCQHDYRRAKYRYFDYGFSGGGPIWKKWLGLKKMYIFAAYEDYQQADWQLNPTGGTVPSAKMLTGDFSELLPAAATANGCSASPCPIMNKSTNLPSTDSNGNTIYYGSIFNPQGNVYQGNIITDPLSPIAKNIAAIYQQDYKPTAGGLTKNYPSLANNSPLYHQPELSFKYDWEVGPSDHIAASYIYSIHPRTCTELCSGAANGALWQTGSQTGGPLSYGNKQTSIGNSYRGSEIHTFSADLVNTIAYTFNAFQNKSAPLTSLAGSTDWSNQVGLNGASPLNQFPQIVFNGSPNGLGETTIGNSTPSGGYVAYNGILNDSLMWTKGRHTMTLGVEYRALGFNLDSGGGGLTYEYSSTTFAPTNTSIQPFVGSAFANFLLGEVQSAKEGVTFDQDSRRKEMSFFGQDHIQVNPRLTVDAGLRWELTRPLHVLQGSWSNFDVTAPNQVYGGIPGAYTWLSHPNDSFETYTDWHQFAPKLGVAYQITSKLVARGSGGINFVPLGWNTYGGVPYGSSVGYTGLNQVVEVATQTPAFQWDAQHYPGVVTPPTGPAPTNAAIQSTWGPANINPRTRELGMTENWYAGVEYQLPGNALLNVSYLGNSGRNLHDGALNPTNFPTWSTYSKLLNSGNIWNWVWDAASATAAGVPYPYPGFSGESYFAINPYPQVQANYDGGVFFTNAPLGQTGYNSFTVEGKKQHGPLNLNLSYAMSRQTGNTSNAFIDTYSWNYSWQNPYNYKQEARWAQTNDLVKGYMIYALPFGRGRRFLSAGPVLDYLVGGWTASTLVSYGNAGDMGAVGSTNSYPGWSAVYTNVASGANFKNQFKKYNPAWNPTAAGTAPDPGSLFVNPANFSNPTFGQLGNSPTLFTGQGGQASWRGWSAPQENASLLKATKFGPDGRFVMTLRAEFYDLFNRHYWNNPNTTFGSAYFGHVTGVTGNRTGQLGARFTW